MTGPSFSLAVGSWPKRDEEAFLRGKQVPTHVLASLLGAFSGDRLQTRL
jgi:hypothetical protein